MSFGEVEQPDIATSDVLLMSYGFKMAELRTRSVTTKVVYLEPCRKASMVIFVDKPMQIVMTSRETNSCIPVVI